jgi:mono/diheme cytochrome c family protein
MRTIAILLSSAALIAFFNSSCDSNPYKQGKILYENFCANCHMDDGTGLPGNIPPLADSDYLKEDPLRAACIIRYGQEEEIVVNGKVYNQPMEAVPQLSDFEIANVINYINHAWGNDYGFVKLEDIQKRLNDCK